MLQHFSKIHIRKNASEGKLNLWNISQTQQKLSSSPQATVTKGTRSVQDQHHHRIRMEGSTTPDTEEICLSEERDKGDETS